MVNIFGFKRGSDARVISFNQSLCTSLKAGSAFHYKVNELRHNFCTHILLVLILSQDIKTRTGYAQGGIISEILQAVWFENKASLGVVFENQFNPIPFETLALIFTVVGFYLFYILIIYDFIY